MTVSDRFKSANTLVRYEEELQGGVSLYLASLEHKVSLQSHQGLPHPAQIAYEKTGQRLSRLFVPVGYCGLLASSLDALKHLPSTEVIGVAISTTDLTSECIPKEIKNIVIVQPKDAGRALFEESNVREKIATAMGAAAWDGMPSVNGVIASIGAAILAQEEASFGISNEGQTWVALRHDGQFNLTEEDNVVRAYHESRVRLDQTSNVARGMVIKKNTTIYFLPQKIVWKRL